MEMFGWPVCIGGSPGLKRETWETRIGRYKVTPDILTVTTCELANTPPAGSRVLVPKDSLGSAYSPYWVAELITARIVQPMHTVEQESK
jgi:hypothetical protein